MKKTKWLFYTALTGLIPFFVRTFIYIFDKNAGVSYWLNESDFITLGCVLAVTNINELEVINLKDKKWKSQQIGFSVLLLIVYSALFGMLSYADFKGNTDLDKITVKVVSIVLASISFLHSYSIYHRLISIGR